MKTAIAAIALLLAQSTPRQFDVASVKVHTGGGGTTRRVEPQSLTYLNITLGEFMQMAFDVRRYQIDGPDWVVNNASSDRFDIVAKSTAPATESQVRGMLAPLLADRFHLSFHRETRVLPIYALVVAKGGPRLKPGDGGEQSVSPDPGGGLRFRNCPIGALVGVLMAMRSTGRPVVDRTGLTGRYTFTANLQDLPPGASSDAAKHAVVENDTPPFTALEEQLGLKLNAERAPIDMLVVDRVDRVPAEN